MTNLVTNDNMKIDRSRVKQVDEYKVYLGDQIRITKDNQTCELYR